MKRRKKSRAAPASLLGKLALFSIIGIMAWHAASSFLKERSALNEKSERERQIQEKEAELAELQSKIEMLKSGEGMEIEARGRLNMKKEGEKVIIIVDEEKKKDAEASQETKKNWWEQILGFIGI